MAQVCRALLLKRVSSEHLLATVRNVALWCPADCSVSRNVPEYNLFSPLAGREPVRPFHQLVNTSQSVWDQTALYALSELHTT